MTDGIVNTEDTENEDTENTGTGGTGETGGTENGGSGEAGTAEPAETNTALALMKARLNRPAADTSLDSYFQARLDAAAAELAGAGITLTDSAGDLLLLVDSAVWAYQNRDKNAGMPDWLRLRRRERWIRQQRGNGT